jgi:hypothetical protein
MDVQQLKARVTALEAAIDKARIEAAQANSQIEVETDEGVVLSLWARITARRNAGKTLVERAAALERHKAAVKAYEAAYKDMSKAASAAFALAEKAAAALELAAETQAAAGIKRKSLPTMRGGSADPYAVLCEALGFEILAPWDRFEVRRPQSGIPATPNPFALHLWNGA